MPIGLSILKDNLERKVDLISKVHIEADFFLEVCNYLFFLVSDERLRMIIALIIDEREHALETYNKLQKEALTRLLDLRRGLHDLLGRNGVDENDISDLFDHFDRVNSGEIQTDRPLWGSLEYDIHNVLAAVVERYPEVELDQYATRDERNNIRLVPSYRETLDRCREESQKIDLLKRTAIWGAWERLLLVYQAAYTSNREWQEEFRQNALVGMSLALLIGEMRDIISGRSSISNFAARIHFRREDCSADLMRVHNFVLDHLDKTSLGVALFKRYKQRCEWYDKESLLRLTESQEGETRNRAESNLTRTLACYLHDNGVIPLSQVIFGSARPDLLGLYSGEELFPIEVKVIRVNEMNRLRTGFNQILTYLRTVNVREGFYVVFCRGDFTLDVPNPIFVNNQRVNIITIDLSETSPSQRTPRVWRITREDLIQERSNAA